MAYVDTLLAGFPSAYLLLLFLGAKRWLRPLVDETRPMDGMPLDFDLPQVF